MDKQHPVIWLVGLLGILYIVSCFVWLFQGWTPRMSLWKPSRNSEHPETYRKAYECKSSKNVVQKRSKMQPIYNDQVSAQFKLHLGWQIGFSLLVFGHQFGRIWSYLVEKKLGLDWTWSTTFKSSVSRFKSQLLAKTISYCLGRKQVQIISR